MRYFLAMTFVVVSASAASFTIQAIGPGGMAAYGPLGISNTGYAAGAATSADGHSSGFHWQPWAEESVFTSALAADVNSAGSVAGTTMTTAGPRATVWRNGAAQMLDVFDSYAMSITEAGDVAGMSQFGSQTGAVLYTGDRRLQVETSGTWSGAYDVSNNREVVGHMRKEDGSYRAFSWMEYGGTVELGTLGGHDSFAYGVNDSGAIAGASTVLAGYLHAFIYQNGSMQDIGTLGGTTSVAWDINSGGQAVGYSSDADGRTRAFLWKGGYMFDLNSLIEPDEGWSLEAAYGINERGQIVGAGLWQGQLTPFLLDPLYSAGTATPDQAAIPEPSTGVLAGGCFLAAAVIRYLHKRKGETAC